MNRSNNNNNIIFVILLLLCLLVSTRALNETASDLSSEIEVLQSRTGCTFTPFNGTLNEVSTAEDENVSFFTINCLDPDYELHLCSQDPYEYLKFCKMESDDEIDVCRWTTKCETLKGFKTYNFSVRCTEFGLRCLTLERSDLKSKPRRTYDVITYDIFTRSSTSASTTLTDITLTSIMVGLSVVNFLIGLSLNIIEIKLTIHRFLTIVFTCEVREMWRIFVVGPVKVGLFCQFIIMPLLGFILGLVIFKESEVCPHVGVLSRIGLFVLSTSPGGTASNWFAKLFDGDVHLSVALTMLSTLLNPITVWFWWNSLGPIIDESFHTKLPLKEIFNYIVVNTLPIMIGMIFKYLWPQFSRNLERYSVYIFITGFGVAMFVYYFQYWNFFKLVNWKHVLAGSGLAFIGMMLGGLTSAIVSLPRLQVITIGIETGMQNGNIAYVILMANLQSPEADVAVMPSMAQIFFTSVPLLLIYIVIKSYGMMKKLQGCDYQNTCPQVNQIFESVKTKVGCENRDKDGEYVVDYEFERQRPKLPTFF